MDNGYKQCNRQSNKPTMFFKTRPKRVCPFVTIDFLPLIFDAELFRLTSGVLKDTPIFSPFSPPYFALLWHCDRVDCCVHKLTHHLSLMVANFLSAKTTVNMAFILFLPIVQKLVDVGTTNLRLNLGELQTAKTREKDNTLCQNSHPLSSISPSRCHQ